MKKRKEIIRREEVNLDIDEALDYYVAESTFAALAFIDELEHAFDHIALHPATGSSRYALLLGYPNLRSWMLNRFPFIIIYIEHDTHIDVWRILHTKRDIPHWLSSELKD